MRLVSEGTLKLGGYDMSKDTSVYQSPLEARYASLEMQHLFSPDKKFSTWRRLWVALAEAECQMGLNVTAEQVEELRAHIDDINYEVADAREREVRHDVMAHVYAYGQQCPKAAGIIHLGATSCYVTDNTDLLIIREGLGLIKRKLLGVIENLSNFAEEYRALPILGLTHAQPATPPTVGKRATLWLQNFLENLDELEYVESRIRLLGCRGATGTSETFMELFDGDTAMVQELDERIATAMGFRSNEVWPVSGQTYPRLFDVQVLNCLANIGVSASKMANDIRILQSRKELEEPFAKNQIGSSAMAYKRNPMLSERICSLSRYAQNLARNPYETANVQWLERTLDDSANRRLSISECFLVMDGVLVVCAKVTDGLVVYPAVIRKHLEEELPFMVTEKILMRAVEKGGDRQELHERIRRYSMEAARNVKERGQNNNLIERIMADAQFSALLTTEEVHQMMNPDELIGNCVNQVDSFLALQVKPVLEHYAKLMETQVFEAEVKV